MLPTIGSMRPNAPNTWHFSTATDFNMARHHILPYNTLRDLWNNLVNLFAANEAPEARVAIRQFLSLCNRSLPNIDKLLDSLRAGRLTVVEANGLQETAVWAAWNIVDGPKNRSDDPGDSYIDRYTFGITIEESGRMNAIEALYHASEAFNANPQLGALPALIASISLGRTRIGYVERPIPFRTEMWEREGGPGSPWHKRRSGDRFIRIAGR